MWEGPLKNWVRACEVLLGLDVDVVVPGHGPLTDKSGVRAMHDYWLALERAVQVDHAAGASAHEIARSLLARHALAEPERIIVNVDTALRELTGEGGHREPLVLLAEMAQFPNRQLVGPAALREPHEARTKNESPPSADVAPTDARKRRLRVILACVMIGMGVLHFAAPAPFVRIMPSALPAQLVLVLLSGFFEALGGIGLLVPRARRAASFGLVLLYLAVFPANVNMVLHPEISAGYGIPAWSLWARLPLQAVLIAWALWVGADKGRGQQSREPCIGLDR
jgi:uncharacterized membrane protein